jgi:hypothetical protein
LATSGAVAQPAQMAADINSMQVRAFMFMACSVEWKRGKGF